MTKLIRQVAIGSIVMRCHRFAAMVAFWQAALGYEVEHEDPNGGGAILRDPRGRGPNISIDQVRELRTGKRSRLHLDLYTLRQAEELERPGARRYAWCDPEEADYVVLEDPESYLFCVVEIPTERVQGTAERMRTSAASD